MSLRTSMGQRQCSTTWRMGVGRWLTLGIFPSTAILNIIAWLVKLPQRGLPPKSSVRTPPKANTSEAIPTPSALSCSGDWKPGVPALSVAVPIARVALIICPKPKSARNVWRVWSATLPKGKIHTWQWILVFMVHSPTHSRVSNPDVL